MQSMVFSCRPVLVLWFVFGMARLVGAAVLLDFEKPDEVSRWHDEHAQTLGADKKLEASERFAASGTHSLRVFTPAWHPAEHGGRQKWPAFEGPPPISDWRGYDRLVFEIVNVTPAPQRLMLFLTDSKIATRSGLHLAEKIPPYGHVRAVLNLTKAFAAKKVNPADMHTMHFYTEDPPVDMVLYLDRFLLLKPGEVIPPLPKTFFTDFAALQELAIRTLREDVEAARKRALTQTENPEVRAWITRTMDGFRGQTDAMARQISASNPEMLALPERLHRLRQEVSRLEATLDLRLAFEPLRGKVEKDPDRGRGVVVAFADSMSKVLPRADLDGVAVAALPRLAVARNETESLQVIVLPLEKDAREVTIRCTGLRTAAGARFPDAAVRTAVMGYVKTSAVPPYGSKHVGWWPDPILDFLRKTDVRRNDAQSFWLRFHPPKTQPSGVYRGNLDVHIDGVTAFSFPFSLEVYPFVLPDASPLPMAITFHPEDHPSTATKTLQEQWRKSPDYPINAWKKHRAEWVDFLADYFITIDSLYDYGDWKPDFKALSRLRYQGRLGRFNLGYYGKCMPGEKAIAKWRKEVIEQRLKPRYEQAKKLGLLDQAYIYGCDEHGKKDFPHVERAAALLKKAFPDVMIMTTTYDHSFGLDSVLRSIDAFCPLTPRYNAERAAKARAGGRQVWWYICCGPRHPYPNMFIEYPAIEGRLLMGAMSTRYRPDGFLYYQISIWNSQHCIESGPFTDWDPRSWTSFHGDGSWTCAGPDGTPLPTIRLENFRDGLEDYAYARILDRLLKAAKKNTAVRQQHAAWISRAEALLAVPDEVLKNNTVYTRDPAVLRRYRTDLAHTIIAAPIPVPAQ